MPDEVEGPTEDVRQQLAETLRGLRTMTGLSQRTLAQATGLNQTKVLRAERGEVLLTNAELQAWLRATSAEIAVAETMIARNEIAHGMRRWHDQGPTGKTLRVEIEARDRDAEAVLNFQPTVLPGLLQTAEYARRIIAASDVSGRLDRAATLTHRLQRQLVLQENGRRFEFLITQAALDEAPAGTAWRAQLEHLLAMAELPTVSLRLAHPGASEVVPWHNFVIRHRKADSTWVTAELIHGTVEVYDEPSVAIYLRLWEQLRKGADSEAKTAKCIRGLLG